jgi:hypothetical protein
MRASFFPCDVGLGRQGEKGVFLDLLILRFAVFILNRLNNFRFGMAAKNQ